MRVQRVPFCCDDHHQRPPPIGPRRRLRRACPRATSPASTNERGGWERTQSSGPGSWTTTCFWARAWSRTPPASVWQSPGRCTPRLWPVPSAPATLVKAARMGWDSMCALVSVAWVPHNAHGLGTRRQRRCRTEGLGTDYLRGRCPAAYRPWLRAGRGRRFIESSTTGGPGPGPCRARAGSGHRRGGWQTLDPGRWLTGTARAG